MQGPLHVMFNTLRILLEFTFQKHFKFVLKKAASKHVSASASDYLQALPRIYQIVLGLIHSTI